MKDKITRQQTEEKKIKPPNFAENNSYQRAMAGGGEREKKQRVFSVAHG